jgi:BirA family biotin operon repressor/biotin-[acetyl-CoA-carboxylase] ligase
MNIKKFDTVLSTNDTAKALAYDGEGDLCTVLSRSQTEGRGTYGRTFFSPVGGIYMSIIIKRDILLKNSGLMSLAVAVAVARALKASVNKEIKIKPINDIILDGLKIGGILIETGKDKNGDRFAVVGVGINFCLNVPEDLKGKAGSLLKEEELKTVSRERLVKKIVKEIDKMLPKSKGGGTAYADGRIACGEDGDRIACGAGIEAGAHDGRAATGEDSTLTAQLGAAFGEDIARDYDEFLLKQPPY